MESKLSTSTGVKQTIELSFSNQELETAFNNEYKKIQPTIEMPGFRKGKVPFNLIKKNYGPRVEFDAQMDMAEEAFGKIVKEQNIEFVGGLALEDIKKTDDGATVILNFEVKPNIDIQDFKNMTVDEPVHVVTDEEIIEVINNIAKRHSKFEEQELIENTGFVVDADFKEVDKESKLPLIGGTNQNLPLYLDDPAILPGLRDQFINLKIGDTFFFNAKDESENAPDKLMHVTITAVKKVIPAEINDELATMNTQGRLNTIEELKEEIGFQLQDEWNLKAREAMENQIVKNILEMHKDVELPESMVQNASRNLYEDFKKRNKMENVPDNEQMINLFKPQAENAVRWHLISEKIIRMEKIEVEADDIDDYIDFKFPYLKGDSSDQAMLYREQLKDNEVIRVESTFKKLYDYILDFCTTNEVSFEEYNKKYNENLSPYNEELEEFDLGQDHECDENCDHDHTH